MSTAPKRNTPLTLTAVSEDDAFKALLPEMVRKLIARVERLDNRFEVHNKSVRHDLSLVLDEQRAQRATLEVIKALLAELVAE